MTPTAGPPTAGPPAIDDANRLLDGRVAVVTGGAGGMEPQPQA